MATSLINNRKFINKTHEQEGKFIKRAIQNKKKKKKTSKEQRLTSTIPT